MRNLMEHTFALTEWSVLPLKGLGGREALMQFKRSNLLLS